MAKKHACLYDITTKAFSDRVKKAATDMLCADWLYAVQLGQLRCRSSATVELRRRNVYSDPPTQLNSTSS